MNVTKETRHYDSEKIPEWLLFVIPLIITAIIWFGATQVLYSADDYQYLHHFAPMRSFADFLKQFYASDPNSQYWRPLASGLAVTDFLLWGWNGMGFHVTNFIIHLLCTALVFYFAKNIFRLSPILASLTMLLFGCAASHEGNLLWAAGRTDVLATIFILAALLVEKKSRGATNNILWKIFAILFFILSITSKEIGVFTLPLIVILLDLEVPAPLRERIKLSIIRISPYCVTLVILLLYRSQFTAPLQTTEQFHTEGMHSLSAFAMNSIYTIGYTLLPIDFETATAVMNNYRLPLFIAAAFIALITIFIFYKLIKENGYKKYTLPIAFIIISGFFTLQSFERWRVYLPSVGLFILCAVLSKDIIRILKKSIPKIIFISLILFFFGFHLYRAVSAENNWKEASFELQLLKEELKSVLASHPERPLKLLFITRPAKLGSAPLMQLSLNDFLSQAELERTNSPYLAIGGKPYAGISGESAVLLNAPKSDKEFSGLLVKKINDSTMRVSLSANSKIKLIPAATKNDGVARRDQNFHVGDTLMTDEVRMILEKTERISAQSIRVEIRDRSFLPIYYDGRKFQY